MEGEVFLSGVGSCEEGRGFAFRAGGAKTKKWGLQLSSFIKKSVAGDMEKNR